MCPLSPLPLLNGNHMTKSVSLSVSQLAPVADTGGKGGWAGVDSLVRPIGSGFSSGVSGRRGQARDCWGFFLLANTVLFVLAQADATKC